MLSISEILYKVKFHPRFIFALLALKPEGEFKTWIIVLLIDKGLCKKIGVGKFKDWANQSQISIGPK